MHIYINGRFLTKKITGEQRYALELVKELDSLVDAENTFVILVPRNTKHSLCLSNIIIKEVGRLKGHLWEQAELPFFSSDGLLISLCDAGPIFHYRQILTIHDTAIYAFPKVFSFTFRIWHQFLRRVLCLTAKQVITVSQFSKKQILKYCTVGRNTIEVIYEGHEHMNHLIADDRILTMNDLQANNYVLAVSSLHPNKNFQAIVKASVLLKDKSYQFIVAGGQNPAIFSDLGTLSDNIKYLGYVTDEELKALYSNAGCFVYPSFYEGFGLPPLEAMVCGCPAIISNAASLPEVFGDAAIYCDPYSSLNISQQIDRIMTDDGLREEMKNRGFGLIKQYKWGECAKKMMDVIEKNINGYGER